MSSFNNHYLIFFQGQYPYIVFLFYHRFFHGSSITYCISIIWTLFCNFVNNAAQALTFIFKILKYIQILTKGDKSVIDRLKELFYDFSDRLRVFFYGRQGMDELSKFLFWLGLASFPIGFLLAKLLTAAFGGLVVWFGLFALIVAFMRALSRNMPRRELENSLFLAWWGKRKQALQDAKDRRAQKDYKFFKCPGCRTWVRVPKGKGKIHIKCRCGYTLYRKT